MVDGEGESFFLFVQHPSPLFIEFFRVGEDPVRTERILDCFNPNLGRSVFRYLFY